MAATITQEQFDRECGYRVALSIMRNLRAQGLLSDREYGQIEPILTEKFSPVWAGLAGKTGEKRAC